MDHFRQWPSVLQRRWVLSALMGAGFLLVGLAVFFTLQDQILLMISVLLTACTIWRCISFYHMASAGIYEVVEGVCVKIGRAGLRKQRSIRFLTLDGNEYSILLGKWTPLRIGNHYRVYFRRDAHTAGMPATLQPYLASDQFLALEDLGEYQIEAAENTPDITEVSES